jgi:hypothetical protein
MSVMQLSGFQCLLINTSNTQHTNYAFGYQSVSFWSASQKMLQYQYQSILPQTKTILFLGFNYTKQYTYMISHHSNSLCMWTTMSQVKTTWSGPYCHLCVILCYNMVTSCIACSSNQPLTMCFHNVQTCIIDKNDNQLTEVSYLGHNIQSETEHEWITPLLSYQAVLLSQKAELCTLVSCDQIYVTDPISSNKFWKRMHNRPQNDCDAKTDESPPHQSCNQPESRPTKHANLVRVRICHLSHRPYASPSCSVMVKRVQNIILRSIIITHSINYRWKPTPVLKCNIPPKWQ